MKVGVFVIFSLIPLIFGDVRICDISCTPDDEFVNENVTTPEWDEFMSKMETYLPISIPCLKQENKTVEVDQNSDIVWDMMFRVYNERQEETDKTLNDCYCEHKDCKSEEFRNCMKEARAAMNKNFVSLFFSKLIPEVKHTC